MSNDKIYSVEQVASTLQSNTQTVYKLLQKGELKGYKQLRKWYVLHSDLIEFIKSPQKANNLA